MPGPGLIPGSEAWLDSLAEKPALIPYHIATKYHFLEKLSVKQAILEGDPTTGFPLQLAGEEVPPPDATYDFDHSSPYLLPNSSKASRQLPFLRHQSCVAATFACKNANYYPCKIKAVDMPGQKAWNNLAHVGHTWHHHYCAAEGLCKSSDEARYCTDSTVVLYHMYSCFASYVPLICNGSTVVLYHMYRCFASYVPLIRLHTQGVVALRFLWVVLSNNQEQSQKAETYSRLQSVTQTNY